MQVSIPKGEVKDLKTISDKYIDFSDDMHNDMDMLEINISMEPIGIRLFSFNFIVKMLNYFFSTYTWLCFKYIMWWRHPSLSCTDVN